MKDKSIGFRIADAALIILSVIPIAAAIALRILTNPAAEGIQIAGAHIFFTVKMPLQDMPITESQVNSWLVVIALFFFCLYMTHGISEKGGLRRQMIAEWIVEQTDSLVQKNMGQYFKAFSPFVGGIIALSVCSSLLTLFGLYPPTSDLNVIAGWAILVFVLITHYKLKGGLLCYLKGFTEPIPVFTPFNIISEFATPVSMSFRHYGNVLSGSVISALVAAGLTSVSSVVLGWLPGVIGNFPLFRVGIPAVLSLYFDIFSGCLQAFIFAMLTMLYVSGGFPVEEWQKRMKRKKDKKQKNIKSA
ncbi:MAG: F0F1 ATP synthase subunit A [Clostridia bacterium]|nr:F0F1 ATP synthase subunit A [Clostridia bacterium]